MTKIVDPFAILKETQKQTPASTSSDEGGQLQSTSAVCNEVPGICPKCRTTMDTASIGYVHAQSVEPVFWCNTCKVTTPKPEA